MFMAAVVNKIKKNKAKSKAQMEGGMEDYCIMKEEHVEKRRRNDDPIG